MKSSIKNIIYILVMVLMACGQSKTNKYIELKSDDLLYDIGHLFAHCYDGEELVQLHFYNTLSYYYFPTGGPDALTITRGNKISEYELRLYKDSDDGPTFSIHNEKNDKVGSVKFCYDGNDAPFGIISLNKKTKICFEPDIFINGYEELISRYDNEAAIKLISALSGAGRVDEDWPIDAKNLSLFLHTYLDYGEKVDYTPLNDGWNIMKSPDGSLTSFLLFYYIGGNGAGSFYQRSILQYWSEGINHVIEDFDNWVSEDGILHGYNFPYLIDQNIMSLGSGDDIIYFFEYTFCDQKPMSFDDNSYSKEYISILGAFRIIDGSIIPVKIFKSKNALLSLIVVESDTKESHFKLDNNKGLLGVPLIETNDYQHHGKYLIYEWNSKTGMFVYNGKIDKM